MSQIEKKSDIWFYLLPTIACFFVIGYHAVLILGNMLGNAIPIIVIAFVPVIGSLVMEIFAFKAKDNAVKGLLGIGGLILLVVVNGFSFVILSVLYLAFVCPEASMLIFIPYAAVYAVVFVLFILLRKKRKANLVLFILLSALVVSVIFVALAIVLSPVQGTETAATIFFASLLIGMTACLLLILGGFVFQITRLSQAKKEKQVTE